MPIRPVQPTDHAEWLRMQLRLWGGAAEEHTQDIDVYFATPQRGITFVVASCGGGLCGFIEVSLRNYAEGCMTSPVAYIGSCTRPLRIIPLPLKPATMPHLTMPERGQYHGFTPFLLPTRSVGPRVALRPAACCRVSARGSDITDSDAHQAQK
jgi:hypothetical protein